MSRSNNTYTRGKDNRARNKKANNGRRTYEWDENHPFINPYNFVSDDFQTIARSKLPDPESLSTKVTGVVRCRGHVKTGLIVPDTEHVKVNNEHKYYPALKINNQYIIPGSTLRGSVRSMYETLTNSCYVTSNNANGLSKRDNPNQVMKGFIHVDHSVFSLSEAKMYSAYFKSRNDAILYKPQYDEGIVKIIQTGNKLHNFDRVAFTFKRNKKGRCIVTTIRKLDGQLEIGEKEGWLIIGEDFSSKKSVSILEDLGSPVKKSNGTNFPSDEIKKAWNKYREVINIYQDPTINSAINDQKRKTIRKNWYAGIEDKIIAFNSSDNADFPLYYQIKGRRLYFQPAQISRIVYNNSETALIGIKKPCTSRNQLCPACSLFGMVGDECVGSRIRVSDGVFCKAPKINKEVTLPILSSPRISYMNFYTNIEKRKDSYDSSGIQFNGRKFYWHHRPKSMQEAPGKMNATYDIIQNNEEFTFDVYYDCISEQQRNDLIWSLTLGENAKDSLYCYHIGHGKPLGYGTVKITIDEINERKHQNVWDITSIKQQGINEIIKKSSLNNSKEESVKETLIISKNEEHYNQKHQKIAIEYPFVEGALKHKNDKDSNKFAAHQWFNESKYTKPYITTLPTIQATQNGKFLKAIKFIGNGNNKNSRKWGK